MPTPPRQSTVLELSGDGTVSSRATTRRPPFPVFMASEIPNKHKDIGDDGRRHAYALYSKGDVKGAAKVLRRAAGKADYKARPNTAKTKTSNMLHAAMTGIGDSFLGLSDNVAGPFVGGRSRAAGYQDSLRSEHPVSYLTGLLGGAVGQAALLRSVPVGLLPAGASAVQKALSTPGVLQTGALSGAGGAASSLLDDPTNVRKAVGVGGFSAALGLGGHLATDVIGNTAGLAWRKFAPGNRAASDAAEIIKETGKAGDSDNVFLRIGERLDQGLSPIAANLTPEAVPAINRKVAGEGATDAFEAAEKFIGNVTEDVLAYNIETAGGLTTRKLRDVTPEKIRGIRDAKANEFMTKIDADSYMITLPDNALDAIKRNFKDISRYLSDEALEQLEKGIETDSLSLRMIDTLRIALNNAGSAKVDNALFKAAESLRDGAVKQLPAYGKMLQEYRNWSVYANISTDASINKAVGGKFTEVFQEAKKAGLMPEANVVLRKAIMRKAAQEWQKSLVAGGKYLTNRGVVKAVRKTGGSIDTQAIDRALDQLQQIHRYRTPVMPDELGETLTQAIQGLVLSTGTVSSGFGSHVLNRTVNRFLRSEKSRIEMLEGLTNPEKSKEFLAKMVKDQRGRDALADLLRDLKIALPLVAGPSVEHSLDSE